MKPIQSMHTTRSYSIGTRICKEFPSYGWFWGTITSKYNDVESNSNNNDEAESDDGKSGAYSLYYYDILYTDGDSETLDHNSIQPYVQYAMDKDDDEGRINMMKERMNDTRSTSSSRTGTVSASTKPSDDSNYHDHDDDDDSEDRGPTNKRPVTTPALLDGRKRPRRSASLNARYDDSSTPEDTDDVNDDDEDSDEIESSPSDVHQVHDGRVNAPRGRESPIRKCRLHSQTQTKLATRQRQTTITAIRRVSPRKSSDRDVAIKPLKSVKSDKPKAKPSTGSTINKSQGKTTKSATSNTTATVGKYDKPPYSGGKDLEVISDVQQMFDDMITSKLLSNDHYTQLLCNLITKLQHRGPIKIATMCSGTESPILAFDMIQNAIYDAALVAVAAVTSTTNESKIQQRQHTAAVTSKQFQQLLLSLRQSSSPDSPSPFESLFPMQHIFSCEIEPYKQAYIERNFNPPILFRDIRELGNEQAYTAYGALVDVPNTPGSVDILIAGTSCVDYSNLNNQKKNMEDKGESGATFYGMLRWIEKAEPPIVIIENVYGAPWNDKVALFEERGYSATFMRLDTKDYYIPHTRQRGYLFAVRHHNVVNNNGGNKKMKQRPQQQQDHRTSDWTNMVTAFKRPASASVDDFMLPNDDPRVLRGRARLTAECAENGGSDMSSSSRAGRVDWTKCETRHLTSRSLEELGDKRPLTNWSDSGSTTLPSFCWNEWCNVQVHRIHDLMDINTLRLAKVGIDSTYKTMVWNLSQNVDRDTMGKLGLCQCLTPTGVPYVTNRGGPLVGEELLMLQGIPVDDLLLTKETEDNLKDLAGNAMSTTVVGACTLCALLVGQDALRSYQELSPEIQILPSLVPRPLEPLSDICVSQQFGEYKEHNVDALSDPNGKQKYLWDDFLLDASTSAKMCVSESEDEALSLDSIAQCVACGHTSSVNNAYPARKYEEHDFCNVTSYSNRATPSIFRRDLLDLMPMRVCITGIEVNEFDRPESIDLDLWQDWKDAIRSSLISESGKPAEFRFADLLRAHEWTAIYESQSLARLEINISNRGVTWFLFANPPTKQCSLRTILERPFARLHVSPFIDGSFSMLVGKWEVCIPLTRHLKMDITGMGEQVPSWRNRLGLKGIFENEVQYETLQISVNSDDPSIVAELKATIDGKYTLLPKCGGACGSLRRKVSASDDDDNLYFYLASNRSTLSCDDKFVISQTFHRTDYKGYRDILLSLDNNFSPLYFSNKSRNTDVAVACSSYGYWLAVKSAVLKEEYNSNIMVRHPSRSLSVPMEQIGWKVCPELLSATFPVNGNDDIVVKCLTLGGSTEVNLTKSRRVLNLIAFATSKWKLPNIFKNGNWLALSGDSTYDKFNMLRSEKCAPVKPKIKWTLVSKGKRAAYIPLEDVRQAAIYERAMKARPKPWLLRISVTNDTCNSATMASMTIQVGCNVVGVVQRAFGLLPEGTMAQRSMIEIGCDATNRYSFNWRVVQHTDSGVCFPKLLFTSNKDDVEAAQPPMFRKFGLRKEQRRSLTWMLNQESTTEPFYEEEVAEAVFPRLNWRIEGRVRRPVLVRGGIIADEVGYGKTAITLGLIDASESINGHPPEPPSGYGTRYIYTKATLIVVPKHLMGQWPDEVRKFLGSSKTVCVIKDLTALNKLTIGDLRSADIVIVSFAVLSNESYFSRLARLCGLNPESFAKGNSSSRHFAAVYAECVDALPSQVDKIVNNTPDVYIDITRASKAYETERATDRVLLDGKKSIYKNAKKDPTIRISSTTRSTGSIDADPWGLSSLGVKKNHLKMSCPPLEAFFWQRLVVDEFTYLANKDREHVLEVVSNIHCTFRWFLSGTPKHANFNDISNLASLLGVHLGIDEVLPGVKLTKKYLSDNDNSGLESLSHYLESRSMQWHGRRHELSQTFLDRFVRQNVAEIDEILYKEYVCIVSLPAVERAIYMELETHLKSLEMNCMTAQKSKRKSTGDRESRMQRILEESESGEEALLKCCSHFNMSSSSTALETIDDIISLRQSEKTRLEDEMVRSLSAAFRHEQQILGHQPDWRLVTATGKGEIQDALCVFVSDVKAMKSVPHGADDEINGNICSLVEKGRKLLESTPLESSTYFEIFDDADMDEVTLFEMKHVLRNHMHFVRSLTKELCGRIRSLRYIENIRQFQLKNEKFQCTSCDRMISGSNHLIGVLSCCGHAGCITCLHSYAIEGRCVIPDCCARVSTSHIASADRLGVEDDGDSGRFGRKLSTVVQKVKEILSTGNDDRVIVFCQFDDLKALVSDALQASNIQSLQVKGTVVQQINTLSIFQKDIPDKSDPRVLLLKMDDEQSAGLNLTNLNHAIFVHPLLASSQEEYNAYETQAIGRIRRYGQKKTVYSWRFLAEDTIDTEIYEMRKKKTTANSLVIT